MGKWGKKRKPPLAIALLKLFGIPATKVKRASERVKAIDIKTPSILREKKRENSRGMNNGGGFS
jgi:hypothetical protein